MIRRNATILLIIFISAFQALSQSREADIFSQLVVACSSAEATDSVVTSTDVANVLTFVESTVSDTITPYAPIIPATASKATGLSVLEAISGAYSGHSYYSTGAWGADPPYYSAAVQSPVSGIPFELKAGHRISSQFGYRDQFNRMHYGIDIAMCVGDTVQAPMPGVVGKVAYDKGYGRFVVILHDNGLETRYAHLSKTLVMIGQRIETGDAIALSGNTGHSTGPHLHLETRYRGLPLDPNTVFDFY